MYSKISLWLQLGAYAVYELKQLKICSKITMYQKSM